jgi:hypothetical protein
MTALTEQVRETVTPYKFGGNKMATALWLLSLDSGQDEETGSSTEWGYWMARFGKRLLIEDSQGFVSCEKFESEDAARAAFNESEQAYAGMVES